MFVQRSPYHLQEAHLTIESGYEYPFRDIGHASIGSFPPPENVRDLPRGILQAMVEVVLVPRLWVPQHLHGDLQHAQGKPLRP